MYNYSRVSNEGGSMQMTEVSEKPLKRKMLDSLVRSLLIINCIHHPHIRHYVLCQITSQFTCVAQYGKALCYRSGGHAFEPCH